MKRSILVIALSLVLTGCFCVSSPPPPPAVPDYRGEWTGTIADSIGETGNMALNIVSQDLDRWYEGALGGSWQADFAGRPESGILRGQTTSANSLRFQLISSTVPGCAYGVEASHDDGVMRGTYLSQGCEPHVAGTLEVRRGSP